MEYHQRRSIGDSARLLADRNPHASEALLVAQERRAEMLEATQVVAPLCIDAFDELYRHGRVLLRWAETLPDAFPRLFVERFLNNLDDSLEGFLQMKIASVLDTARDYMELTVLVRDFRLAPQRYTKWLKSTEDDRRRDFGFGRLLYAHDEVIPSFDDDRNDVLAEYTAHSRTLHPTPFTVSLARANLSGKRKLEQWIYPAGREIVVHASGLLVQLQAWLASLAPESSPEGEPNMDAEDIVFLWISEANRFITAQVPADELARAREQYRPARRSPK